MVNLIALPFRNINRTPHLRDNRPINNGKMTAWVTIPACNKHQIS